MPDGSHALTVSKMFYAHTIHSIEEVALLHVLLSLELPSYNSGHWWRMASELPNRLGSLAVWKAARTGGPQNVSPGQTQKLQLVWSWALGRGRHTYLKLCLHSKYPVFSLECILWHVRIVAFSKEVFIFTVYLLQHQSSTCFMLLLHVSIRRLSFWKWHPMRHHTAAWLFNHCWVSFNLVALWNRSIIFHYWISIAQSPHVCFCWYTFTLFLFPTITNDAAEDDLVWDPLRAGQRSCEGYRARRREWEIPFHHDLSSHTYTSDVGKFLGLHFANLLATRWHFPDN